MVSAVWPQAIIYSLILQAATATATIPDWARRTFLIGRKKMVFMNFTIAL
ncbi:hypothetical protein PEX1_054160 [Penicillium expansum]|uniref:Uncharacterized protein n=1 Tax=Penicillium expansum TaxID=27334 RepID=A0A0A2I439_PENEN|nr:hypothetical protein PEX2_085290 [Penicillium expansum]KGO37146.1 hypothetical protein PEXP_001710 [Penicillium expansum]KGO50801.1 hypothetical protein PEX1_054160 [Penicillium expansum]KGO61454.1 hypothetical protein PEX2_085290 [Penicillium expansum]